MGIFSIFIAKVNSSIYQINLRKLLKNYLNGKHMQKGIMKYKTNRIKTTTRMYSKYGSMFKTLNQL